MSTPPLDYLRGAVFHLQRGIRHADDLTTPSGAKVEHQQRGSFHLAWARDDLRRAADLIEAQGPHALVSQLRSGAATAAGAADHIGTGWHVDTAALDIARADAMRAIWALGAPG